MKHCSSIIHNWQDSSKKRHKDAAVLKNASWSSGVMNFSADTHHARLWRHLKALFKAWRFRRFQAGQLCFSCGFFKSDQLCLVENRDQLLIKFDRGRIVAYRDCGLSFREIGSRIGRNQTTVMRICDRWMQEGTT
ncbi:transposable element Tcb1 transposase [Trichonephila clavipes]|nr:transposable element Tcb1 transposase [Trichonephila clavipes]